MDYPLRRISSYTQWHEQRNPNNGGSLEEDDEEEHPIVSNLHRISTANSSAPDLCSLSFPATTSGDVIFKIDTAGEEFPPNFKSKSYRRTNSDGIPIESPWRTDIEATSPAHEFSFRQPGDELSSRSEHNFRPPESLVEESASSKLIGRFLEVAAPVGVENVIILPEIEPESEEHRQRRDGLPPLPPENFTRQGWGVRNEILSPSFSVLSDCRNAIANARNAFDGSSRENRVSFQESMNSEMVGRGGGSIYSHIDCSSSSASSSISGGDAETESRINGIQVQGSSRSGELLRFGSSSESLLRRRISISAGLTKAKSRLIDRPPITLDQRLPKSGTVSVPEEEDDPSLDDDLPEEFKEANISTLVFLEWVSLITLIGALICSLIIPTLTAFTFLKLRLWKWLALILALISGRLVSGWIVRIIVFFIEQNFLLRKRVLYFVYGLKKGVQNVIWLGIVLLTWHLVFDNSVDASSEPLRIVTKLLIVLEIGAVVWLFKTLLIKVCASNFHVSTFFERIQESLFNQFVIETLSGPPLFSFLQNEIDVDRTMAEVQMLQNAGINIPPDLKATVYTTRGSKSMKSSFLPTQSTKIHSGSTPYKSSIGQNGGPSKSNSKRIDEGITIDHLHKLNQNNVSAWSMKRLVRIVRYGALSTLDEHITEPNLQDDDSTTQIKSEVEAKAAARKIFSNVARPHSRYIYLDDLLRFMREDEALKTMDLFEASESDGISKSSLKNWVVHAFRERRALSLTLNDTKTAVIKLHKIVNVLVIVIIALVAATWLNLIATKSLFFFSSQIVVVAFVFGNTCKNVFECIIFLFVIHPFDIGDRCEIDGVQMIVEEMNILTTVFLRSDNLKILFPNYTLLTKPICNFYRSPDMGDSVEICFHIATPVEKISLIRQRIVSYIENKKEHWYPNPTLVLRDMVGLNMLKIAIGVQHRMNHQDMAGRWTRRALLIEECVKIFKELDIDYRVYPVNVNIQSISNLNYPLSNLPSELS